MRFSPKPFLSRDGFAALFLVAVLGAVALLAVLGRTFIGLGSVERSFLSIQSGGAVHVAEGCLEEALLQLRLDPAYRGGALNLNGGSCILSVQPQADTFLIQVTSTLGVAQYSQATIVSQNGGGIHIDEWSQDL